MSVMIVFNLRLFYGMAFVLSAIDNLKKRSFYYVWKGVLPPNYVDDI